MAGLRFPFPRRRSSRSQGGRRPVFGLPGRGAGGRMGGGLKARLLIALAVAAFAFLSYYGKPGDLNEVTGESERVAMADEDQEIVLGLQAAPQLIGQHGGVSRDVEGQQLVEQVGERLLRALDLELRKMNERNPERKLRNPYRDSFRFTLLADRDTVNAFALPGGPVFITKALFDRLENEGQLAGVIGHEIGHVLARHGNKRMAKQGLFQGLAGAVGVLGGEQGGARMGQMIASVISMKYGREDELESDDWGVRLCMLADYDPTAMLGVMDILKEASGGGNQPEFMSTHPAPANRKEKIKKAIEHYRSAQLGRM